MAGKKLEDINLIVSHIANGGSLIHLCETLEVRYSDVILWILAEQDRKSVYHAAIDARGEWFIQNVLGELTRIINVDIRQAFNSEGGLKNIQDIPVEVAKAMAGVEVSEIWDYEGTGKDRKKVQVGELKKVKFWNKLPALEMLGKNLKMFIERHEHDLSATLEQLVAQSFTQPPKETKTDGISNGSDP